MNEQQMNKWHFSIQLAGLSTVPWPQPYRLLGLGEMPIPLAHEGSLQVPVAPGMLASVPVLQPRTTGSR